MASVADQLEHEIVSRLGVLALLDGGAAEQAVGEASWSAAVWAAVLEGEDRDRAARVAPDVLEALWPGTKPPARWWKSKLGVCLANAGA